MDIRILRVTYHEQLHMLDMFFHKRLWKNPHTRHFLEVHKQDLLADLFEELVKIHDRKTYRDYDPVKLIFIKAKKVWIAFIRSLEREAKKKGNVGIDTLLDTYSIESFREDFESRNTVSLIREFLDPGDFNLLQYRADGYTYKQILELAYYPSEDAAKTRYYRVKNLVKQHFHFSRSSKK
jgi:hypothetical protein